MYDKLKKKIKKRKEEAKAERLRNDEQDRLLRELSDRMKAQESALESLRSTHQAAISAVEGSVRTVDGSVQNHESRLRALETSGGGGGSGSGVSGELEDRVERLERRADETDSRVTDTERKAADHDKQLKAVTAQCQALESTVSSVNSHLSTVEQNLRTTDERSLENRDAIEALKKLIHGLEEALRNKADADAFDQLRGVVGALSSKSGGSSGVPAAPVPMMSTKDLNLLKELDRRVLVLEEAAGKAGSNSKFAEILQRLETLEHDVGLKANQEDLDTLLALVNKLRGDIERLEKWLREMEDRPSPGGAVSSGDSGNKVDSAKLARLARRVDVIEEQLKGLEGLDLSKIHSEIRKLWEAIEELKAALDKLRKELMAKLRELEDLLSHKVDASVIADLERKR